MQIRDRITELRRVRADQLRPNPRNWRTHPPEQRDAMRGVLSEIGYADALLARPLADGTLELIDGHLRAETTPEAEVPVLVLDLDDQEAAKLLAVLDPLAGLALADAEFDELMCVREGAITEFRQKYIAEIVEFVKNNADLEFGIIWKENKAKGIPRAVLTDLISEKINRIKDAVTASGLFENKVLVKRVIAKGVPPALVEKAGVDRILKRVPEAYLKALFASALAGHYIYKFGLDANEINFYEFLKEI